jgi:polar amino acid transport system substrate-binding protein
MTVLTMMRRRVRLRPRGAAGLILAGVCLACLPSWPTRSAQSDPTAASSPELYTEAQAEAGKAVFMQQCASCHGPDLQGRSAPANGGAVFLNRSEKLGWSVGDLRYVVVTNMPYGKGGSLSAQEYAQVLAFLLASDCYSPGATPFPTDDTARLEHTKLLAPKGARPNNREAGTCDVK